MIILTRLPTDETVRQIVTCELVPLFVNSLQQVQNRYVSPSQNIASMVVMERDLMMRFSPPTEITPEPTPEFVLNYDASCLPPMTPPETIIESGNGDSLNWVTIPPLEGEFSLLETVLEQSSQNMCGVENEPIWCSLLSNGDVFTYSNTTPDSPTAFISINRVGDQIFYIDHVDATQTDVKGGMIPSWGAVTSNHARLAFACLGNLVPCYWDSQANTTYFIPSATEGVVQSDISPDGTKIAYVDHLIPNLPNGYRIYDIVTSTPSGVFNAGFKVTDIRWSDNNLLYYFTITGTFPSYATSLKSHIADSVLLGGTGNLHSVGNNGNYYYDVHEGQVLYWRTAPTGFNLYYSGHTQPLLHLDKLSAVHWSPDGTRFMLLYPTTSTSRCIRVYDIADVSTYTEIACNSDYRYGVAWGGGVDLTSLIQPPPDLDLVCTLPITAHSDGYPVRSNRSTGSSMQHRLTVPLPRNNHLNNTNLIRLERVGILYIVSNNPDGYDWIRIRYDVSGNGIFDTEGWMGRNRNSEPFANYDGCSRIPRYDNCDPQVDQNCQEVPLPVHDYVLPAPPDQWFNPDWLLKDENGDVVYVTDRNDVNYNLPVVINPLEVDGHTCLAGFSSSDTSDFIDNSRRACAKIVYYIYYHTLTKIYGSPPRLSDVIGTIYQGELSFLRPYREIYNTPLGPKSGYMFSQDALKANYWITCGDNDDYPDCRSQTDPTQFAEAYLYQLQAWYGNTFSVLGWYTSLYEFVEDDQRERIAQAELEGLGKRGWDKFKLLIPDNPNIIEGETALVSMLPIEYSGPWHWGNYGYGTSSYINMRNRSNVVFCINNRKFEDNRNTNNPNIIIGHVDWTDDWLDDIFVLTSDTSSDQTSTYDKNNVPPWLSDLLNINAKIPNDTLNIGAIGCYDNGASYVR